MAIECTFERISPTHVYSTCCDQTVRFSGDITTLRCRCPKQNPPRKLRRAANFSLAAIRHVTKGFPTCSQAEIDSRWAICQSCDKFDRNAQICKHEGCGCYINRRKWLSKVGWQDSGCPLGKWKIADPAVVARHLELLNAAVDAPLQPPTWSRERGIVIGAGGSLYFACAWIVATLLREHGCELPIQFWHLGQGEIDSARREAAASLDVETVDARELAGKLPVPPRILNGWELKPFSVLHAPFREVLYLDADCLPVRDPTYLFDDGAYRQHRARFWSDFVVPGNRIEWVPDAVWRNAGMEPRKDRGLETGQFMIDRERSWRQLNIAWHLNDHSDYWYNYVFGDTATFNLAWRKCGADYALSPDASWDPPAYKQPGPDGEPLFEHVTIGKDLLEKGQRIDNLTHADSVAAAAQSLQSRVGKIWAWHASDEAKRLAGRYVYKRIGLDQRELVLAANGVITWGWGPCEKRWSLHTIDGERTLVIVGGAHKGNEIGMMFLRWREGAWRGRWEAFERCEVELKPVGRFSDGG